VDKGNAEWFGGNLIQAFHETMMGVGTSLEARGEMPETAEEFADIVTRAVFDQLGGALMKMNRERRESEQAS